MPERLKVELTEHLRPVEAPEGLWERIEERRTAPRRRIHWVALAAAFGLMTVGTIWLSANGPAARTAPRTPSATALADCALCHTHL